jgi:hypothetical protein
MTETTRTRPVSTAWRLAVPLMVIGLGGCDNVEWGGIDLAIQAPPPRTGPVTADVAVGERLPAGPLLYYVHRDTAGATVIPVGEIIDERLEPIRPGDDPVAFGDRFISAYLRQGAELTLFRRGRRAGTLIVDSAAVPTGPACQPLPRATGAIEISDAADTVSEFLAMARTQAPDGRMLPGGSLEPERRMQVVGNILAERVLRSRGAQLPNWSRARRQLQPFPVSETRDLGFTATFLVDDELRVGNDDQGYSLFVVYTPQAQTGYDTTFVDYVSYTAAGKAAPRVIDFLDWDRDGSVELLLEVYGTRNSWFEAVGPVDGEWRRVFRHRCDERSTSVPIPATIDTVPVDTVEGSPPPASARSGVDARPPQTERPRAVTPALGEADRTAAPDTGGTGLPDPITSIRPTIQLSDPGRPTPPRRDTQPDTSGTAA